MTVQEALENIRLIQHPLVRSRMTTLRDKSTSAELFRRCVREISIPLALAALEELETEEVSIETPLAKTSGCKIARSVVLVPVLRAGLGFAEGMLEILPGAVLGHIGMFRNEVTHLPEQYYFRVPPGIADAEILLVDPMLATGNSAAAAVTLLKNEGAQRIRFVGLVGCPEGVATLRDSHPDVPIFLAALDSHLNENCYIVPGLGDAGDRYFGTA